MRIIYLISLGTQYVSLDALVKVWQQEAYAITRRQHWQLEKSNNQWYICTTKSWTLTMRHIFWARHYSAFLFTTTTQHYLMCRFMKDVHVLGELLLKQFIGICGPEGYGLCSLLIWNWAYVLNVRILSPLELKDGKWICCLAPKICGVRSYTTTPLGFNFKNSGWNFFTFDKLNSLGQSLWS